MTLPNGWKRKKKDRNGVIWYSDGVTDCSLFESMCDPDCREILVDTDTTSAMPVSVALAILDDNNLNETANELREKLERAEKMFDITARMLATSWTREFGGDCGENLSNIKRKVQGEVP